MTTPLPDGVAVYDAGNLVDRPDWQGHRGLCLPMARWGVISVP